MNRYIAYIPLFIVCIIFLGSIVFSIIAVTNTEEVSFTVIHTERVANGYSDNVEQKYLVFTENETFECTDSLFYWKWNSSDVYGQMRPGTSWNAKVVGFRIPFMSAYRNIIEIKKVNQ